MEPQCGLTNTVENTKVDINGNDCEKSETLVGSQTETSLLSNAIFCRICHQNECEVKSSLISPCKCSGSMAYAHQYCLQRWASSSSTGSCDICGYNYVCRKKYPSGFSWLKRVLLFKRTYRRDAVILLMVPVWLFFMGLNISLFLFFDTKDYNFGLIYLIFAPLLMIIYSIRALYTSFACWQQQNIEVELVFDRVMKW